MLREVTNPSFRLPKLNQGTAGASCGRSSCSGCPTPSRRSAARSPRSSPSPPPPSATTAIVSGAAVFVAYALGMGAVGAVPHHRDALAKTSVAPDACARPAAFVHLVSALFLLVPGIYVAYYGWYRCASDRRSGATRSSTTSSSARARLNEWIVRTWAPDRLGLLLGLASSRLHGGGCPCSIADVGTPCSVSSSHCEGVEEEQ